jgi:hypothetical protein
MFEQFIHYYIKGSIFSFLFLKYTIQATTERFIVFWKKNVRGRKHTISMTIHGQVFLTINNPNEKVTKNMEKKTYKL